MMPNAETARENNERYSPGNRSSSRAVPWFHLNPSDLTQRILPTDVFHGLLCLESKRTERSKKHRLPMAGRERVADVLVVRRCATIWTKRRGSKDCLSWRSGLWMMTAADLR